MLKGIINVAFLVLLFSHVGLSSRPTDVNAAVLAHIASLGFFLLLLFAAVGLAASRGVLKLPPADPEKQFLNRKKFARRQTDLALA